MSGDAAYQGKEESLVRGFHIQSPTTRVRRHFATWQGNPHWTPEVGPADSTLAHPRVESFTTSFCSTYTRRTRVHLHPRIAGARWIP